MRNIQPSLKSSNSVDVNLWKPRSENIRLDVGSRSVFVRDVLHRSDENPWKSTKIEFALLPPTVFCDRATRLVDDFELFDIYLRGLEVYAARQAESKSLPAILNAWSMVFVKTAEFAWINGFYDLRDVPEPLWERFHDAMARGGWCDVLQIESRVAKFVSSVSLSGDNFLDAKKTKGKISVKKSILRILGTNISGRELASIKGILLQAVECDELREAGDIEKYEHRTLFRPSAGAIATILNSVDVLSLIDPEKAVLKLPGGSRYAFALKKGVAPSRTKNIDPDMWAHLLKYAYKWIFDYSCSIAIFASALARKNIELSASADTLIKSISDRSADRLLLLQSLPERELIEGNLGFRVTSYLKSRSPEGEISVNALILNLYISCFIVLASMNARRKDEIIGSAIGLHTNSLRKVDEVFDIYECEFYMEKRIKGYRKHYVNDVSKHVLEVMSKISNLAWWLCDEPSNPTKGRERKLFFIPNFLGYGPGKWFRFSNNTIRETQEQFVKNATGDSLHLTPHMLRRGYGLLYHYRYDNAQLVALSQKYGHFDVSRTFHYVSDPADTPHGKTAVAKWSSRKSDANRDEEAFNLEIAEIVSDVGIEKIKIYISEVVDSSRSFSGGFSKLVARFHRKLGSFVRYGSLDRNEQKELIADLIIARGHNAHPYPWANCMAGSFRKHSACTSGAGEIARENASPLTCGRCPYSDTNLLHVANLEADAEKIDEQCRNAVGTLRESSLRSQLRDIRRIIELHKIRLGVAA